MLHRAFDRVMPDFAFRMMAAVMAIEDRIHPTIARRVPGFGLRAGMTIVDYGCGPGRYLPYYSQIAGLEGKVYAVDVHPLAVQAAHRLVDRGLRNIVPTLAQGYDSTLPAGLADAVCALDMFFGLSDPSAFLAEVRRICKPTGFLILDDGHEPRSATLAKLAASGLWQVTKATPDHLKSGLR